MKRNLILAAVFALALAATASAQKAADFSGTWTLDVAKSNPAEQMIESQTVTIVQTATDVKIERNTKMKPMPEGSMGGRGMGMGQPGATTYGFAAPVKVSRDTPNGAVEISFSAKLEGNKLTLTTTSPQGSRGETWTLNADGTATAEAQGRGGAAVVRTYKKS